MEEQIQSWNFFCDRSIIYRKLVSQALTAGAKFLQQLATSTKSLAGLLCFAVNFHKCDRTLWRISFTQLDASGHLGDLQVEINAAKSKFDLVVLVQPCQISPLLSQPINGKIW